MTNEELEAAFQALQELASATANAVKAQDRQIGELQEVCVANVIRIKELELLRDTGYKHRYCKECGKYVMVFSAGDAYMNHPHKSGIGKCGTSTKRAPVWS